jgi:hypothetical protein
MNPTYIKDVRVRDMSHIEVLIEDANTGKNAWLSVDFDHIVSYDTNYPTVIEHLSKQE